VINGSTDKVVATLAKVTAFGSDYAYDPDNGVVYLISTPGPTGVSDLSRLPTKSPWTVTTITVGKDAFYANYDPATLDLVVSNFGSQSLSIVNSSSNKVTTVTLNTGQLPQSSVYTPTSKDLYVIDQTGALKPKTGNITVLDSSNKIKTTLSVNPDPVSISLNSNNHDVYVVNATLLGTHRTTNSTVTPITSANVVGTPIKVGQGAFLAAYDPTNHDMYVAEEYSNVTAVISSSNTVVTLTTKGSPIGGYYDPATSDMLLLLNNKPTVDGKILLLSSPTSGTPSVVGTQAVEKEPFGVGYDPTYSKLYVSNEDSNSMSIF
jgi:DNA-binding beta-propeller fold protein YncE